MAKRTHAALTARAATGNQEEAQRRSLGRGFSELGGKPLRRYLDSSPEGSGGWPGGGRLASTRGSYGAVAIASGKGGTGKSTVAANLAVALGGAELRVLLVDADFALANLHLLLGLQPKTSLARLLLGGIDPREASLEGPPGIRFVPGCSGVERMANLHPQQLCTIARALTAVEDGADIVVLDTAAGLTTQTVSMLGASSRILLVTTPDIGAMTDAYALLKLLSKRHPDVPCALIVNRARSRAEAQEVAERLMSMAGRFLGRSIENLGWVPEDPSLSYWAGRGRPVVLAEPWSRTSRALKALATRLMDSAGDGGESPQGQEGSYFGRLCERLAGTGAEEA